MVKNQTTSTADHKWKGRHEHRGTRGSDPISALGTYIGKMDPCNIWFENQQGLNPGEPKDYRKRSPYP